MCTTLMKVKVFIKVLLWLGQCYNTLTPARTPRHGLCHNTLTPARTPRHGPVSQHIGHQQEHQGLGSVTTHWHQQEHQGVSCVTTHWHQQEHQGLGCVTTQWCQARTPRLRLVTLTPARTPRCGLCLQHTDTSKNTKAWALLQHTDTLHLLMYCFFTFSKVLASHRLSHRGCQIWTLTQLDHTDAWQLTTFDSCDVCPVWMILSATWSGV